ncbi:MAG TPA: META domain-containing protein [Actinophytocola sp.]|uniref:META domain-containing protein n=1 Tax=Actinophytocola sp. TaxID=1872138 RepID=UPI002DB59E99|nr:META domain-containing protein [Actinophytocola sp.]HEU5472404.1 META domain-containing protein [Actinophytocola sp.]
MKATPFAVALLTPLALLAAACGDPDPAPAGTDVDQLRGRTFVSTDVTENGQPRPLVPGTSLTIQFTDDGRLLADAGCNKMSGAARIENGALVLDELGSTMMACDEARADQDQWLSSFLTGRPTIRLDGANLILTSDKTEVTMLDRTVADPGLPLEGTHWQVDTLMSGDIATSTPSGATATLEFKDGTLNLNTGCNTGSGSYQLLGDKIRFGPIATTKMACEPELMALETAIVTVLDGIVDHTIDADVLTLTHPSNAALKARGQR